MSPIIKELLSVDSRPENLPDEEIFKTTGVGSTAGIFYERLRNVIDYKDEHLLRRNAIERILRRKILFPNGESVGTGLVKELIWAGYLGNNSVRIKIIIQVDAVVDKYVALLNRGGDGGGGSNERKKWILGVASAEIDELLVPGVTAEALVRAMYRMMVNKTSKPEGVSEGDWEVQIFIAVRKSLLKEDTATIRFHLLSSYVPELLNFPFDFQKKFEESFPRLFTQVEKQLKGVWNLRLARAFSSFTPPFLVIKDLIDNSDDLEKSLENPETLEYQVRRTCEKKYLSAKAKLGRSIFRSTAYIFLTKMLLAYALEMPADLFLYGKVNLLPMVINVIFPPSLMYFIGSAIKIPGKSNTDMVVGMVLEIVYGEGQFSSASFPGILAKRSGWNGFFAIFYLCGFIFSFGVIIYLLKLLGYGVVSGALFLFFLSVVSFFTYRITLTAREYQVLNRREGLISGLVDFFTIPILQMGQFISTRFSKINIFMFIFDFIIEAPFKAFIEIAEDWIAFLKQKKEEII